MGTFNPDVVAFALFSITLGPYILCSGAAWYIGSGLADEHEAWQQSDIYSKGYRDGYDLFNATKYNSMFSYIQTHGMECIGDGRLYIRVSGDKEVYYYARGYVFGYRARSEHENVASIKSNFE